MLTYCTLVPLSIGSTTLEMAATLRDCRVSCLVLLDATTAASEKAIDAAGALSLARTLVSSRGRG